MKTYEDKNFNVRLEFRLKNAELIKARESLGLNQRQAAELIGISQPNLGQIELLHKYPSKRIQEKICLGYSVAGYSIQEEDVFPEKLKEFKIKGKFTREREIPVEKLIQLSSISERLLPQIEPEAIKEIYEEQMHETIIESLSELDERRRKAIMMYFGIDQDKEFTYEEIGKHLNITGRGAQQLVKKTLIKLRHPSRRKRLIHFYEESE